MGDVAAVRPLVSDGRLHDRDILSCPASRIGMMSLPLTPAPGPEPFDTAVDAVSSSETIVASAPTAPPLLQLHALGTPEAPTVGSIGHSLGECKPCAFFYKQGCQNGVQC